MGTVFKHVPSGQRLATRCRWAAEAQLEISYAKTEVSGSAILQISCPSKTRWHHHTKDYKQIASRQSTNKVSLSCQVLAIVCDSQEQETSCPKRHCRNAPGEGTWAMCYELTAPVSPHCHCVVSCTSGVWIECVTSHACGFSTRLLSAWVGSTLDTHSTVTEVVGDNSPGHLPG